MDTSDNWDEEEVSICSHMPLMAVLALLNSVYSCGKTTLCHLISVLNGLKFFSINCHLHTEAADFLGGLHPVRLRHSQEHDQVKVQCDVVC